MILVSANEFFSNSLSVGTLLLLLLSTAPQGIAQTYEEFVQSLRNVKESSAPSGVTKNRAEVLRFWKMGKLIDDYSLEDKDYSRESIEKLAAEMKEQVSVLYYALQFARAYPDSPPELDLPLGFYRYLLAINDPRERNELANRAFREKWNWDQLRAEIKDARRNNKEFVFTDVPGKTGVYRVVKAKRGPYRGQLVLDLGLANDLKLPELDFQEYEMVQASCPTPSSCTLKSASGAEKDLFTYSADVISITDGDTFQAVVNLGFGMTTRQNFRLWGLDAPEFNTKEGREAKKVLEGFLLSKPVLIRANRMEKYGRYLADVWVLEEKEKPLYLNQTLIDRRLAVPLERD